MDRDTLSALQAPFAPADIKQREGNFGKTLDYLETHTVIQRLNEALVGDWSFHIVEHVVREDLSEVIVVGKLVAGEIVKMQIGSASLKRHRQSGELMCLGDDLKAAASDALKKCATLLGVGLQLYRSDEPRPATSPPVGHPRTNSSADPPSPRSSSSSSRLSPKQHQLILKLAAEAGISKDELNRHCQQQYGRVVDFLAKAEASRLIEGLFAGAIQAA